MLGLHRVKERIPTCPADPAWWRTHIVASLVVASEDAAAAAAPVVPAPSYPDTIHSVLTIASVRLWFHTYLNLNQASQACFIFRTCARCLHVCHCRAGRGVWRCARGAGRGVWRCARGGGAVDTNHLPVVGGHWGARLPALCIPLRHSGMLQDLAMESNDTSSVGSSTESLFSTLLLPVSHKDRLQYQKWHWRIHFFFFFGGGGRGRYHWATPTTLEYQRWNTHTTKT